MKSRDDWIRALELKPHPEGGYFREVFRSEEQIPGLTLPPRYTGPRAFATSIYFLLPGDQVSRFHRLKSDELWYYHAGCALTVHVLSPSNAYRTERIGNEPESGESLQVALPWNSWFGATVDDPDGYTLVGCLVAPGFEFVDFELARRAELLELYPQYRDIILRLTPPS